MQTILVVDDEIPIREVTKLHLEYLGYNVVLAENGKVALDKLKEISIDIIVTDISMPIMNGLELIIKVKESFSKIKIIVMTGYTKPVIDVPYLSKPFTSKELKQVLQNVS